jgi:hypothetical protein
MGFFELGTAESMLEKAKRELTRLEAEHSIDNVYNFFVTAYHIIDYLDLPESTVNSIRKDPLIRACGDACNKAKHMKLTRRPDVKTPKHYHLVLGTLGAPLDTSNSSSVEWCIDWQDGTSREVVSFTRSVIARWGELFLLYGVAP